MTKVSTIIPLPRQYATYLAHCCYYLYRIPQTQRPAGVGCYSAGQRKTYLCSKPEIEGRKDKPPASLTAVFVGPRRKRGLSRVWDGMEVQDI